MKKIMGMAQAIFGLIWFGIVALFLIIGIGVVVTKGTIEWLKEKNKEAKKDIKEYYDNVWE
jgi:hypothetical protein